MNKVFAVPIKVLNIIKSLGRGGAEMLLPETLRLHSTAAFEFHYIYFLPWKNQVVAEIEQGGGKVTCIRANNNIQLILRVKNVVDYIKEHDIDIVHAHLPWAGIVARLAGKWAGVNVIYTEHNKQERYHFLTRWLNLATMNWLTKVIAVSRDVEDSIRKNKTDLRTPVQTILNGVNTERYFPGFEGSDGLKDGLGIPREASIIGTVAVFRFQKRLDVWIEIARSILKLHPRTHFILVGDGPLKDELVAKSRQLDLLDKLHFVGLQTEIRPYLGAFDIYMMTSLFEGLPIALLEAMSSGCAVISTDAGGIKEVIEHGKDGLVCGVEEPEKLVQFADLLLRDPATRNAYGQQARETICSRFSMTRMVHDLEKLYREQSAKTRG